MKRVALYGGSFDPPHNGHLEVVRTLLRVNWIDEVWIAPTGIRRSKATTATPLQRFTMVELAVNTQFAANVPIRVLSHRTLHQAPYPTATLFKFLLERCHEVKFHIAAGPDVANKVKQEWFEGSWLVNEASFVVVPGRGEVNTSSLPSKFLVLDEGFAVDITSSTEIRRKIQEGEDVSSLVPPTVITFIQRYNLYL